MNWRHRSSGEVISDSDYSRLPYHKKSDFIQTSSSPTHSCSCNDGGGDFIMSALIGAATDSGIVGGLLGGDLLGGILGDALNDNDDNPLF